MGAVFAFVLLGAWLVEANHIPFEYDWTLNQRENFEKAGHPELYQVFLDEMKKNNHGKNTYENKIMEMLNKPYEEIKLENGNTSGTFTFTLLQPLPTDSEETLKTNVTLKQYLTWAYKFALALTGFLAVMMIVIGGVEWIISGASESMISEAKKHINGAITGLIIALVAYLVLYTINPSLVDFESNWFFKPRDTQTQNTKTNQTDNNFNVFNNADNVNKGATKMKDLNFDEKVMQDTNNKP